MKFVTIQTLVSLNVLLILLIYVFDTYVGDLHMEEPRNQEEVEVLDVSCEPCSSSETIDDDDDDDDDKSGEIVEISDEERSPECLESVICLLSTCFSVV